MTMKAPTHWPNLRRLPLDYAPWTGKPMHELRYATIRANLKRPKDVPPKV